jgi:hypothetical protein
VVSLSLSEAVCFDRWKNRLLMSRYLAASWQRWLASRPIDFHVLYGPIVIWAFRQ